MPGLVVRASITSELVLDDVRVPDSAMLPEARGLRGPLGCLTEARFGIVWGVTGSARDALACALEYACSRTQFGKPIAGFQLTQRKLAELAVSLQQLQLTARRLGELKDAGRIKAHQISFGKFANVRGALDICREARSILGPSVQIGVTCHDSRHLAMEAGEAGADYVAFGSFYPTTTKEVRHHPDPAILSWWSTMFELPCVAIGGITPDNARPLIEAGADFLAVSGAVWNGNEVETVEAFGRLLG